MGTYVEVMAMMMPLKSGAKGFSGERLAEVCCFVICVAPVPKGVMRWNVSIRRWFIAYCGSGWSSGLR